MNESSSSMAIESLVRAGNNLSIYSGSNLLSEGARLHSGEHLTLLAAMDIQLLAAQDSQSQAQAKSKRGLLSSKAKTNNQSQIIELGFEFGFIKEVELKLRLFAAGTELLCFQQTIEFFWDFNAPVSHCKFFCLNV